MLPTLILTGPTACGKTELAIDLALSLSAGNQGTQRVEIISADSLQIYRGMDIGTAKPTSDELKTVRHHLIDELDPDTTFSAAAFAKRVKECIHEIQDRGHLPLIVGGTGFYLKALLFGVWDAPGADRVFREGLSREEPQLLYERLLGLDPKAAQRIGKADHYRLVRALEIIHLSGKTPTQLEEQIPPRPDPMFELWILDRPNTELAARIEKRTQAMLMRGPDGELALVAEYKRISAQFQKSRALDAIGYAQVRDYLGGVLPKGRKIPAGPEGLSSEIVLATRQLVKSQKTWFKKFVKLIPDSKIWLLDQDRAELEARFREHYGRN